MTNDIDAETSRVRRIVSLPPLLLCLLLLASVGFSTWCNNSYPYKIPLTPYYNQSVSTPQQNIIGYVSVNTSDATRFNQTTGTNIRVYNDTDCSLVNYKLMSNNSIYLGNSTNNATYALVLSLPNSSSNLTGLSMYIGNVAAPSGEILRASISGSFCNQTGLLAMWPLGEGSGTTAAEICNGNTGTITNTSMWNTTGKHGFSLGGNGFGGQNDGMTFTAVGGGSNYTVLSWAWMVAGDNFRTMWGGAQYNFVVWSSTAKLSTANPQSDSGYIVTVLANNTMHLWGLSCSGGVGSFYVNGSRNGSTNGVTVTCRSEAMTNFMTQGGGQTWNTRTSDPLIFNTGKSAQFFQAWYSLQIAAGTEIAGNAAPNITYINLTPTTAFISSTLLCNVTATDDSSTSINISYNWFRNGVNQTSLAGSVNVSNNTNTNIANLSSSNLMPSDNWSCTAQAYDGNSYSAVNSSANVTINNTAPIIDQVTITPVPAFATSNLSCNVQAHDTESPQLNISYQWFRNGTNITTAQTINITNNTLTSVSNLTSGNFTTSDVLFCLVNASDGVLNAGNMSSPNVTISGATTANLYTPSTGSIYPNSTTSINFLFSCSGPYPSFFVNITINGTNNVTAIPTLNGTNTSQAVSFFGSGQYDAAVNCYNDSTTNRTSTPSIFSIINFAPNITQLALTPNGNAYQLGPLAFNITYVDWESSTATLFYSVFLNGSNQTSMAGNLMLTNNTLANVYLDRFGPFNPTDYWNVSVFVVDTNNQSATIMSNNTTIGNYFSNVNITNSAAYGNMNFTDTLALTLAGAASSSAYFLFNGSNITGVNGGVAPMYSFVANQVAPFVYNQTNVSGNWYYRATLTNGSYYELNNTTTILVNPNGVFACGSDTNTSTVVFSFINAINGSAVNATLSTIIYEWGANASIVQITQTNTTQTYCILPSNASINITDLETVSATGYASQVVYRSYLANTTTQFFTIYLYPTTSAYAVQLLVQQYPAIPLSGVNISIFHFTAPSNYTLYQSCTTGTAGTCLVYLIPNTAYYQFNFTYQGVAYTFGPETLVCNPASTICYRTFTILQTVLPPYIVGGMTGSCVYSNSTYRVTCTGTDPSATISSFNITTYYYNGTQICTNTTAGSSATLSCSIPNLNGTYSFRFTGSDNTNTYVLSYGNINIGKTASDFGRDGWLAMLFLFVIISLAGIYSPILSIVLGSVALLGGGLIGLVPMGGIMSIVIVVAVVAGFLAYRMRF